MRVSRIFAVLMILALLLSGVPAQARPAPAEAPGFATPGFQSVWARTDSLVAKGAVARSWVWGPGPGAARTEAYTEAPGGQRTVQYFDKARMEVNPAAPAGSPWAVTTGLLVVELVSGRMQTGDQTSVQRAPAEAPVAGDADPPGGADPLAPVYRSFAAVASLPDSPARADPDRTGAPVTETINRAGTVGVGPDGGVRNQTYVAQTGHNIPNVFWRYMNAQGPVLDGDKTAQAALFDWVYVLGYPITEAYWAVVPVNGTPQRVLIQLYQRRVLTYAPANDPAWQVQMGNVGAHYYAWRYNDSLPTTPGLTAPAPAPNPSGDGFVSIAGDQFIYAGAPITLKGTNWWNHTSPFADTWVSWDGPLALDELAKAKELGINTIRVGVPYDNKFSAKVLWDCPTFDKCTHEGISPWILNEMNQLLQIAGVYGMKVIFSIFDWSDSFPPPGSREYRIHSTYLHGLITPFAGDDRVLAWDIHNEPENYGTWASGGSDKVLVWAQQTIAMIHALDQRHPVTIGVGSYDSLWKPGPGGLTLLDLVDFASFHSYDAGNLGAQIAAIRAHTHKPILLEEMGWPTGPAGKSTPNAIYDENRQTYLYTEMLRVANEQHIAGVVQYTLWDFPIGLTTGFTGPSTEENFGLVRLDGSFKPAAAVFRDQYSGRILPSVTQTYFALTKDNKPPTGRQSPP